MDSQKVPNCEVGDFLKHNMKFRELIDSIRVSECDIGPQSQSPGSSSSDLNVRILNVDYLSKTELLFLCFLTYYLNTRTLRFSCPHLLVELLVQLPEKVEKATYLTMSERIELWKLFSRRRFYFTNSWPLEQRAVRGILSDPKVISKVARRLYQRVRPHSSRVKQTQRIRGYRDHGTLRPAHEWKPSTDFSLTELQNKIELERKYLRRYYQLALAGKDPVAVEDFPTLFDKS